MTYLFLNFNLHKVVKQSHAMMLMNVLPVFILVQSFKSVIILMVAMHVTAS